MVTLKLHVTSKRAWPLWTEVQTLNIWATVSLQSGRSTVALSASQQYIDLSS